MRRRKNLIPTVILTVFAWTGLVYLVLQTSPNAPLPVSLPISIPPLILFFPLLFCALFLSFTLLFNNTRRGFLVATGVAAIVLLRFFHLFHPLYIIFIIALLITTELYFLKK